MGLSPRVRGNLTELSRRDAATRSIPACAGEPPRRGLRRRVPAVYPRVCGGTPPVHVHDAAADGLSPRVRGNRKGRNGVAAYSRSIPACAGEPSGRGCRCLSMRVYPRVCGGTTGSQTPHNQSKGLSPRVRGNPGQTCPVFRPLRSIPACAGEPGSGAEAAADLRVYPRVCGGTGLHRQPGPLRNGLSPRVRGNPLRTGTSGTSGRSIPACAGEPCPGPCARCGTGVYPRVCGGTQQGRPGCNAPVGLSPRVRGNR